MGEIRSEDNDSNVDDESGLNARVLAALRRVSGGDFSDFRSTTLQRRISRRMGLVGIDGLEEYVSLLEGDDAEVHELFRDILINVTGFFRDPGAFDTLARVAFPEIISRDDPDGIRLWVPGCSTGEEPYSLAIALSESLEAAGVSRQVQIFATDINEAQIARARVATYSAEAVSAIAPERLERYFDRTPSGWRVRKRIREMCVFARHDLTRDPPFTRIDLVSCRNLLIYWNRKQQDRVIPLIHYALRPSGFLLLGSSESAGRFPDQFELVDRTSKLYRRRDTGSTPHVRFRPYHPAQLVAPTRPSVAPPTIDDAVMADAGRIVALEAPRAAALVDEHLEGLYFWGETEPFFVPSPGEASLSLVRLVARGLLSDVMSAVDEVRASHNSAWRGPIAKVSGRPVYVHVVPLRRGGRHAAFLVLIGGRRVVEETVWEDASADARSELEDTREQLAVKVEELTATNEELRTAEDELHEINRELVDANREQEAHTSRLQHLSDDLANVLASASIPMIVLDGEGRIRRFTPPAESLLEIRTDDIGRPLADLAFTKEIPDLARIVDEVSAEGDVREQHLVDTVGRAYVLRVSPFVSEGPASEGVVLAFLDVEQARRNAIEESSKLMSALTAINATINSLLDTEEITRCVVTEAVDAISADFAILYRREGRQWIPSHSSGLGPERIGTVLLEGDLPYLIGARQTEPWSMRDCQVDAGYDDSVLRKRGCHGLIAVQLAVRDQVVGVLVFGFLQKMHFTEAKLDFVGKLGTAASIALENARLYGAQRHVADLLQEALLQMPEHVPGIEYSARYLAAADEARVGGDFYDLFEIGDHRVAIVIGDVSGKGLAAASLTALAKNAIRAHVMEDGDPAAVFTRVNRLVHKFTPTDMFLTAFLGVLDVATGDLAYCSAGHPPPLLVHSGGAEFLRGAEPILGAFEGLKYTTNRAVVGPRDALLLYTDGIIEARDGAGLFGEARLLDSAGGVSRGRPDQMIAAVMSDALSFAAGHLGDDVALLALRRAGVSDEPDAADTETEGATA